jgi:hypothetical protein
VCVKRCWERSREARISDAYHAFEPLFRGIGRGLATIVVIRIALPGTSRAVPRPTWPACVYCLSAQYSHIDTHTHTQILLFWWSLRSACCAVRAAQWGRIGCRRRRSYQQYATTAQSMAWAARFAAAVAAAGSSLLQHRFDRSSHMTGVWVRVRHSKLLPAAVAVIDSSRCGHGLNSPRLPGPHIRRIPFTSWSQDTPSRQSSSVFAPIQLSFPAKFRIAATFRGPHER